MSHLDCTRRFALYMQSFPRWQGGRMPILPIGVQLPSMGAGSCGVGWAPTGTGSGGVDHVDRGLRVFRTCREMGSPRGRRWTEGGALP